MRKQSEEPKPIVKGSMMIRRRSYLSITLHIVWATHGRQPYITGEVEDRLHDFCAAVARRKGCDILAVGGAAEHVHILLTLPATIRVSDLMRDLKSASSHYMTETLAPDRWFDWQNGYAAISVSPSHRGRVIAYIRNQKAHPANGTTRDAFERDSELYTI